MAVDSFVKNYQTYLDTLASDIREYAAKEGLPPAFAAERAIAERLGYDLDEIDFIDGAGDRGIDFWYASDGTLYIYQVKTHEFNERNTIEYEVVFDNEGVVDLMRAQQFLLSNDIPDVEHRLSRLKDALERLIRNHSQRDQQENNDPLDIYLTLIILGKNLTDQAIDELADFEAHLEKVIDYQNVNLQFHVDLQTIDDILRAAWREDNRDWRDADGNKCDSIRLTPMRQADERHYLNDGKSAIFYCRATDMVNAYAQLGYQIFEPNVRANIRNSNVNSAIQKSASYNNSMKEFRFLNNGLTITCNSYKLPHGQRTSFEVERPGIVNGLQTVIALYKAYRALSERQKLYFDQNCFVLVRLLRNDAVERITEVVLATNNQNPMQLRNLVSNTAEQTHFAQFYANELHWFYEAKQGAWEAFKDDPERWRPRVNQSVRIFKAKVGYKKVDNLDLAQDWLAFLGFADKAANDKKNLFDKGYYDLIFLNRLRNHSYGIYSSVEEALKNCDNHTPDPYIMLAAHLSRIFASNVVPSATANRRAALGRKGVEVRDSISPAEEEKLLSEDQEYILNQALNTMSLIFVEFVGYCLFHVFGEDANRCGSILLRTQSWRALAEDLDWRIGADLANGTNKNFDDNDLLVVMWLFFREAVETLMGGAWQISYRNERYKPRFVLRNRNQLYQEIMKMDASLQRKVPMRVWTNGIHENEGFFGYLQRVISDKWSYS